MEQVECGFKNSIQRKWLNIENNFIYPVFFTFSALAASLKYDAVSVMRRTAGLYREKTASHGGYVYYCSLDLNG